MNLLVDALPTAVEIDGKEYEINTSFRDCLRTILAFEDEELTGYEKQAIMLQNLFPEPIENVQAAFEVGTRFLNGGKVGESESESNLRLYSFDKDAALIFAAFRQTHGIDLETAEMHWWKFMALFADLGGETTFCNLIGLRKRVKTGVASKEEKQAARDMGSAFDIPEPDDRTPDEREKEAEFLRMIGGGK